MLHKLDAALSFHEQALRVRSLRQEVLAGNIANADTPGYKAKELDFKAAMDNAEGDVRGMVQQRRGATANQDGNTVAIDQERNAFLENALRYEVSLTLVNNQIRGLMSAVEG